jgi:hypothetical protein
MNRNAMKCLVLAATFVAATTNVFASNLDNLVEDDSSSAFIHLTAGLGVSALSSPTIVDYILAASGERMSEFATASEFYVAPEVQLTNEWSLAVEYSFLLKSYTVDATYRPGEFSYTVSMPTLLVHHLTRGTGYWLKYGGGLGLVNGTFTERNTTSGAEASYGARGVSLKVEAVGNTEFDEHFWGNIELDLRWVSGGVFKESSPSPRLSYFAAGIKFGIMVQLF